MLLFGWLNYYILKKEYAMNYNCFPPKGRLVAKARITPAEGYHILGEVRFFKSLKIGRAHV